MPGIMTPGITFANGDSTYNRNTWGYQIPQLVDNATFSGFSDDESGDTIAICRVQASAPSAVQYDAWSDTATRSLRVYDGSSSQLRWDPIGVGVSLVNGTGSTRAVGDVVDYSATTDMTFQTPNSTRAAGVVMESTSNGVFGFVRFRGISTVKVTGAVARGDFLRAAVGLEAVTGGSSLTNAFGIALTAAAGPGSGTVTAYVFGSNA